MSSIVEEAAAGAQEGAATASEILSAAENMYEAMGQLVAALREFRGGSVMLAEKLKGAV